MNKIIVALKSRTVWTIVAMFIIGGVNSVHDIIPSGLVVYIDALLGAMAIYFRVNPKA